MKILLGTNTFKTYKRQDIAIQSYKNLKEKYPDKLDIIDIQFNDEKETFENIYNLDVKFDLTRSSLDVIKNAEKKLPFVNDLFNVISNYAEDYCIFTNSDVIINSNLIDYILKNEPMCFACSRLDIEDINDYSELKEKIKPVRWEIAGFDTFIFKKNWFRQYKNLFNDYLLGKPEFDHIYAGIMKCFGDNTPLGNQYPPFCFHIHHGLAAVLTECKEKTYNENILKNSNFDLLIRNIFGYNFKNNLLNRKPFGSFLHFDSEKELKFEQEWFNIFKKSI